MVEEWLDVCERVVASASIDGEFIRTVLEMIRLSSETNLSYAEVVDEYQAKVTELKQLEGEIEEKTRQLNNIKARHK